MKADIEIVETSYGFYYMRGLFFRSSLRSNVYADNCNRSRLGR